MGFGGTNMKTNITLTIDTAGDKIWDVFAHDFDNAYKWMAGVPKSVGKDNGEQFEGASSAGRVCDLNNKPQGPKASESFLAYNEEEKSCTVLIEFLNTPMGFPLVQNVADFSLIELGGDKSEVTFTVTSTLRPMGFILYPVIKLGFRTFVKQIMEELKFYVENGTPHPRKVKAINKVKASTTN
jgi:hypothetical protein